MLFKCPRCSKVLDVTEEQGGQTVACPGCGTTLAIPAADPIPVLEPLPPPTAVRPAPSRSVPAPAPRRGVPHPAIPTVSRRSAAGDAPAWRHVHTALVAQLIATGGFLAGLVLIVVGLFVLLATAPNPARAHLMDSGIYRAGGILVLASWAVAALGHGFAVMAPGNRGEGGLGMTSLLLSLGVLVLAVVIGLQVRTLLTALDRPGPRIPGRIRHPEPPTALTVLAYLLLLAEGARLTVFAFFQRAVGQSLRDQGLARAGLALAIGVFVLLIGDFLFVFLSAFLADTAAVPLLAIFIHSLSVVLGASQFGPLEVPGVTVFIHFMVLAAVAGWYVCVLLRAQRSVSAWLRHG